MQDFIGISVADSAEETGIGQRAFEGVAMAPMGCALIGCWRITEADLWDRVYLDLCGPATMTIQADGHGEIAYGAMLSIGFEV